MTIEERIVEILSNYNSRAPLRRQDLLDRLRDFGIVISDREMRDTYSKCPLILSSSRGIYLAQTKEEIEVFYKTERKRGLSILIRARNAKREFIKNHKTGVKIDYQFDNVGQGEMFVNSK